MRTLGRRAFLSSVLAMAASPVSSGDSHFREVVRVPNTWQPVIDEARAFEQCRSLMIYHQGMQVAYSRFYGPAFEQPVPVKSVSKTVVAALTGIAIERGEIPSLETTLEDLIPELIPKSADERVRGITVENLLTMRAGLKRASGPGYDQWTASSNWIEDALSRPIVEEPGSSMLYSTATTHVLGAILSKVSGTDLLTIARDRLGQPLRIQIPTWTRDPQGRYLGGNEMALTITAMIRFGEMYRNEGRVGNKQVLSRDWVNRSLQPVTRSIDTGLWYGFGWFIGHSRDTTFALARGYGGQIICIIPELDLTVAITSDPTLPARSHGYFGELMRLIEHTLIPTAFKNTTS